jgi:hypothetical protein
VSARRFGKRPSKEIQLVEQQVLSDLLLGGHMGDADQGQNFMPLSCSKQSR